jgi:glycosyltransferase involved in cell wall biosynthesis
MKPPRLLICCNSLAYFINHRLAPALLARDDGLVVHVAASTDCDPAALSRLGLIHEPLFLTRHRLAPFADFAAMLALRRLIRTLTPEVVHAITMKAALVTLAALPADADCRVIVTFPGLGRIFSDPRGLWSGLRKCLVIAALRRFFRRHRRATATFENSVDRDFFVSRKIVAPENTAILRGTGIDLSRFAPRRVGGAQAAQPPTVLFAGRLLQQKGVVEFINAARSYLRNVKIEGWPNAHFSIAGEPDPGNRDSIDRSELEALTACIGITLLGHVDDMPSLLHHTDILCLPTRYGEGLPRILLEAAASAVPAVVSDTPGCREIVVDGETGRLVPTRDSQGLLEALHELVASPQLRENMGRRARSRIEDGGFDEETIAQAFLALYRGD